MGLVANVNASQPNNSQNDHAESPASCFSGGSLVDDCLILEATPGYNTMTEDMKRDAVSSMMKSVEAIRAVVKSSEGSTLWYESEGSMISTYLGDKKYNLNDYKYVELDRMGKNRWFLTFGGQFGVSDNITLGANARGGTFLLQNIIDLGLGIYINAIIPYEEDSSVQMMYDLSSRLYLSKWMPKSKIIPYAGLGLGYSANISESGYDGSFEPVFSTGANWYLSKGSIDAGLQYGTERGFCFNIGYTLTF